MEVLEGGATKIETGKACRACGGSFIAYKSTQAVCSPRCAMKEVADKKLAEKIDRVTTKRRLRELDPKRYGKAKAAAQQAFNRYIRLRDASLSCVSCDGTESPRWDAGHYLSRGARPELSFHEDNVAKQCARCNTYEAGNTGAFRNSLIARIGLARVEALEGPHATAKWSVDDLREIRRVYAVKAKELEQA